MNQKIEEAVTNLNKLAILVASKEVSDAVQFVSDEVRTFLGLQEEQLEIDEVTTPGMKPDRLCIRLACKLAEFETLLEHPAVEISTSGATAYEMARIEVDSVTVEVSCRVFSKDLPEEYATVLRLIGKMRYYIPESRPYETILCDSIPF